MIQLVDNTLEGQETMTHIPSTGTWHSSEIYGNDHVKMDGDPRGIGEDGRRHM